MVLWLGWNNDKLSEQCETFNVRLSLVKVKVIRSTQFDSSKGETFDSVWSRTK